MSEKILSRIKSILPIIFVMAVPIGIKLYWWHLDGGSTRWDDSYFIDESIKLYDALFTNGILGLCHQFLSTAPGKGPIMSLQAVPVYLILGRRIQAAELINVGFIIALSTYLYLICRLFWSRTVALTAILTTSMCPLIYGLCNHYLREYQIAAYITATAYHLLRSEGFRNRRQVMILGVLMGLGTLFRVIYPLYVFPIYLAVIVPEMGWFRGKNAHWATDLGLWLKNSVLFLLIAFILAIPWFWANWNTIISFSWNAAYGEAATHYGSTDVFSWSVIRPYLYTCICNGISVWQFYLALVCLVGSAIAVKRRKLRLTELFPPRAAALILAWMLPFFIFLFGVNKDYRFAAPLVPAFGILLAVLMWGMSRAFLGAGLVVIAGFIPAILICLNTLFGVTPGGKWTGKFFAHYRAGGYAQRPNTEQWPLLETVKFIHDLEPPRWGKRWSVTTVTDSPFFNHNRLGLVADLNHIPLGFSTCLYFNDARQRQQFILNNDYVLEQIGKKVPSSLDEPGAHNILDQAAKLGLFVRVNCPIQLPDGSSVGVWRRVKQKEIFSAAQFLDQATSATIEWPGKPEWARINKNGNDLSLCAWPSKLSDPTSIRVKLVAGHYSIEGKAKLRPDCGGATRLEFGYQGHDKKEVALRSFTIKPGEDIPIDFDFKIPDADAEVILRYVMEDAKTSTNNSNLILYNFCLSTPEKKKWVMGQM